MRTFIHTILLTILCLQGSMVVVCLVRFGGRCRSLDGSIYTCSSSYICNYDNCMCPEQISHYFDLNDQSCKPRDFVNIAKGKPTSMSAPKYVEHAHSWRANDGNYGADVSQCAYPHIDVVPSWWKVNLLAYYEIHRVIIYSNYLGQHCRMTLIGGNYRGNVNITKSGKTCQAWSSVTPHKHHFNGTLADQKNYCRNPDTEPEGPWCYTTDVNSRWEYCDVHYCVRPFREYAVEVLSGSKVFLCNDSSEARNVYLDSTCASNTIGREVRITTTGHTLLLCEVDINGTLVNLYKASCVTDIKPEECITPLNCSADGFCDCESPATQFYNRNNNTCIDRNTYKENCSSMKEDTTCYNNLVCVTGVCDCEIPAMQYHDPYAKSCKGKNTYKENCTTLVGDSTCYNNMVCVSDICDCEFPVMQYNDPYDKTCKAKSTYNETCSTLIGDSTCYNNMVCVSDICDCEIPAMQYHYPYDKSCKAIGTYRENCTTLIGDSTCYNNMVCVSDICDCEIPATQYHDPYDKSCKAIGTYRENCTTLIGDSTCYNNMVCVSGFCDCEIPSSQYHDPNDKSCKASHRLHTIEGTVGLNSNEMKHCSNFEGPSKTGQFIMLACKTPILGRYVTILKHAQGQLGLAEVQVLGHTVSTYNEDCSTTVGDASCYNNMVCVSGICDCEIPAMQYHDPSDKSCKAISTYNENCSTPVGDASCYNNMVCISGICDCEIPATQYHYPYDKSCKALSTYNENCTTLIGDSTCYNNMVCVSDICDCEIPAMQYHDPYAKSCEAIRTYKENCSTLVGDSTCYNNMVCLSGTCDCEIPALQYYVFYDKSCKTRAKFKEPCQTSEDGSNCYGNMICVSGVCGCNTTQYYNPNVHSCNETGRYLDPCSTAVRNISCYPPLLCSSSVCHCELPAMMHYDADDNTCNDASFNAEEFVNDTKGFGNIVGATMDSIHHMHIEIEEKEHIIEEMVTVLAVLPTENEAAMENVLEASNQISKEADALSDNVQDALLIVMDKISDQISHTDFNKSEPGRVENMVKSLFDSSSNLLDLNHVPERHTVKEKVIVEDKSETEDVIHVEETEPEQEVPYESPEEQQETQVQQTEAEIKAREKKIERTKKLLHTVDIIADSALKTLSDDEPKTMEFSTKTMNLVVGVSKLNNSTNTSTDISTSRKIGNKTVTSSFKLPPEIKEQLKEASKNGFKFQMLFSDKNPRSWDKSSAYINSPMISLILKDLNQKTLGVTKLPKPIIIDIPIGRNEKYSEFILNSKEDNFIRLKVKQPANMFYMLKLMTDGPQYNISVKIAIEFHKQVSLSDAENGTLISNTQIAFLKEPEKKSLYWSLGVIVNDRSNGNISQNISVRISSTAINCRYWNNTIGKWVPDGCQVSPVSSSETLECECDHLTDFAGGVFVLPHIVDPFQDALLFLTFFDNPVVVTVVILVWLIYFLGLYRARQADRKDSNFDGIVTPFPSDPSDPFKYLMCIVTGWRYDARTTANVSCYIKGNTGQSARHCLSRTSSPQVLFTSGGEDWFLITSSYDIGDMVNVIVWHDNSGSSPSWFLSRIIIQDLQTKKVFNFYYDNWLGIQSGTAKVCLSIKSGYELKQQFFLRTSQDLRRGHLWISIISKPPCSNFTRAQRLSCALSLLFCTMLSCLMFHGIPTDETISSDVASIQFEFSLKDFIIGLESSIIMFPINFAIIELFVRSKTKQLHKERYMEIGVNRPTTSDEKGSDKKDNEIVAVKRWMFPWWVLYIAWTTTILTSLVSSYFVMLYGLKYGYYESLNWLVSFLTAFVDDVFLMEPISVVFFAMLFTFILKREIKIDSAPALIVHKPEKNNTLLQKRSNTKTFIPGHASKKDLKKAKQELDLKEKIQTNLQDIVLYVFFTFMLLFVVHNHRPVEKCFMQSQDINNIFIQNTLAHVKTRGDIWTYINESVIPPLSRTIPYDMSKKIPENDFLLIGKFRLRQIRVKRDSCKFPDKLRKLFGFDHLDMKCTSTLNTVNDDNDNYNKSWQIQSQLVTPTDEWSFQNAWDLESVPYLGERAIYGGGGYLVDMNTGPSSILKLSELMLKSWIDTRTRAFFIEFVLYNPNVNMYSSVMIVFEYSSPGTLTTSFQIYTTPLSHYSTSKEITSLVFEIVFFLLTIVVSYIEIKKIRLVGLKIYFKRFWNKLSMLMLILCYTSMAIFIERFRMITHIIRQYRSDGRDSYINFSLAILWDCILFYILALLTVFTMIKVLKLLMLNQKLKYLFSLMEHVKKPLKYFFFIYLISLLAFACCGHLLFGASLAGYRSFGDSLMVLIECTFRIVNYNQYLEFHPELGPLFILLFIFIFVFGLMNMFTVIVMNAQKSLRQKGVKHDDQLTLLIKYFVQSIRRMFR